MERERIEKRGALKKETDPASYLSTQIAPASGCIKPIVSFKVTLFPIPLLPKRQKASPGATSNETLLRTALPPNERDTSRKAIAGALAPLI
jgi:hypothetical protein